VLTLERQWLQKVRFDLQTSSNFHFEVDATAPTYGAQHQKVAIIDGQIAFLGSADICQDRWDTSEHAYQQPLRIGRGETAYKPFHEVQVELAGAAARSLVDMFVERWADAQGETLDAAKLIGSGDEPPIPFAEATVALPSSNVGIYREFPQRVGRPPVSEVKELLQDCVAAAQHLIYIETQYLTSKAFADALAARMRDASRPKLEVIIVLPHKPETLKEELAMGGSQAKVLAELDATAKETGHALGIYNVAVQDDVFVYIHSKLVLVDDRVLTIGSANLTNRSMSIDSEVHAAWVAPELGNAQSGDELSQAIASLRRRLLAEHIGGPALGSAALDGPALVRRLDAIARSGQHRLRAHDLEVAEGEGLFDAAQDVVSAYADPEHAPHRAEDLATASTVAADREADPS
jgi:phosphatidylserine/phosphatidylglycerophosphate/cardiolipin synthase-like enzyme